MKVIFAIGGLAVAGAVAAAWAGPSDEFDPVTFFTGRSHGEGTLHEVFKGDRRVRVDSVGRVAKGGVLILDQTVRVEGDKPKTRRWQLRPAREGWSGTLTDAKGQVVASRDGESIRIRYKMDGGLKVEQVLTPRPGWRQVDNKMKIKKFGMVVARLDEKIVKR